MPVYTKVTQRSKVFTALSVTSVVLFYTSLISIIQFILPDTNDCFANLPVDLIVARFMIHGGTSMK